MSELNNTSANPATQESALTRLYGERNTLESSYKQLKTKHQTAVETENVSKLDYDRLVKTKEGLSSDRTAIERAMTYQEKKAELERQKEIIASGSEENKAAAKERSSQLETEMKSIEDGFKTDNLDKHYLNYSQDTLNGMKESNEKELSNINANESSIKQKYENAKTERENLDTQINENVSNQNKINSQIVDNKWAASQSDISSLGLNNPVINKYSADGVSGSSSTIESMSKANEDPKSESKYFAKDISPDNDNSELSVVTVKKDDKYDENKSKLEGKGFKEIDKDTAKNFKDVDDTNKQQKESESNNENGGSSVDESEGGSSEKSSVTEEPKPDKKPTYSEKKKQLEDQGIKEYKKDSPLVIAGHIVQYVKVNGNNKIRFPIYEKVMGLPPMKIFEDNRNNTTDIFNVNISSNDDTDLKTAKEYFLYNIDEQLNNSFPILTIRPLDCENDMGVNGKMTASEKEYNNKHKESRYNVVEDVVYKFAVTTNNSISYSHQNNFSQSSAESSGLVSNLNSIGKFTSDLVGISQTSAGYGYNNAIGDLTSKGLKLGGDLDSVIREINEAATNSISGNFDETGQKMVKTVSDVGNLLTSLFGGGRIDFPDVWQDSQTNFQQQFTIELRTLNPDPNSEQYFNELLLPLYILLTLSLPTEGNMFSYKTPPLITCSLDDSFMEILLGAVTQISWSFDAKEINFKKVPYHCTVNITIRDLYSVMSQRTYTTKNEQYVKDEDSNREIMTKEKYINNFVRTADKKVPNEKYYLTEFAKVPAYLNALEKMQADEEKAAEDAKKETSNNQGKSVGNSDTGKVNQDSDKNGAESSDANKTNEIQTDPKTGKKSLVQSIGGFVAGVTRGIKNITAGINKAIAPVKKLIDTGKVVLGTALNLKTSIKMIGQTANLSGILNGSFAASTRLAFDNLGKAGNILSGLSGGVLGEFTKSIGTVCNTLSDLGRSALVLDLPSCVGKDGKTVNLVDQINVASSVVGATLGTVRNIANTVQAAKQIGAITKSSDPLATLNTYLGAANSIINDIDFTDRLLNATKGSAIATGQYSAGQLSSNATLQEKFAYVAATVVEQARSVNSTMFNTTFMEYMVQQDWFNKYFTTLRTPTVENPISISDFAYKTTKGNSISVSGVSESGVSVSEATGLTSEQLSGAMGKIDTAWSDFAVGVGEKFASAAKDITIVSANSGLANVAEVPVTVTITANNTNSNSNLTAGGNVTIG